MFRCLILIHQILVAIFVIDHGVTVSQPLSTTMYINYDRIMCAVCYLHCLICCILSGDFYAFATEIGTGGIMFLGV